MKKGGLEAFGSNLDRRGHYFWRPVHPTSETGRTTPGDQVCPAFRGRGIRRSNETPPARRKGPTEGEGRSLDNPRPKKATRNHSRCRCSELNRRLKGPWTPANNARREERSPHVKSNVPSITVNPPVTVLTPAPHVPDVNTTVFVLSREKVIQVRPRVGRPQDKKTTTRQRRTQS